MSTRIRIGGDAMKVVYPKEDRMGGILSGNYHTKCGKSHRTIAAAAKCCWPKHVWVQGDGPYATVSYCVQNRSRYAGYASVMLHQTEADALKAMEGIDAGGCGGVCTRMHEVFVLRLADEGLYRHQAHP